MSYHWKLSSGPDQAAGQADDVAHTVDALHRALDEMAATSAAGDVEGTITRGGDNSDGDVPFWMMWHPLAATEAGEPTRDLAGTRETITELVESLRAELHRAEDQRALAG